MASIVVKSPIRRSSRRLSSHGEISRIAATTSAVYNPEVDRSPFAVSLLKESLSQVDRQILSLVQDVPKKAMSNEFMEHFHLYSKAVKVYQAVVAKKLPHELGIHIPNRAIRRKTYQLVFNALYRKFLDI